MLKLLRLAGFIGEIGGAGSLNPAANCEERRLMLVSQCALSFLAATFLSVLLRFIVFTFLVFDDNNNDDDDDSDDDDNFIFEVSMRF